MKYRIALWASAGFLVACCWVLYGFATAPAPIRGGPTFWTFAGLTCPVLLASHLRLQLYWVLFANTATYALAGLVIEKLRHDGAGETPPTKT